MTPETLPKGQLHIATYIMLDTFLPDVLVLPNHLCQPYTALYNFFFFLLMSCSLLPGQRLPQVFCLTLSQGISLFIL